MRVKICGITNADDARTAARAGADAIGLVFAESPRRVTVPQARAIVAALPPFVTPVGLFVDAQVDFVRQVAGDVGVSVVQLHGDEPGEMIDQLAPLRVLKGIRVRDRSFVDDVRRLSAWRGRGLCGLLLDAFSPDARGGTGKRFDWDLLAGAHEAGALVDTPPLVLAGGLTPDNVAAAVRRLRPWALDVSSGVESQPGRKDPDKIERFITQARNALNRS